MRQRNLSIPRTSVTALVAAMAAVLYLCLAALPVHAAAGFDFYTDSPGIHVTAGDALSFNLHLAGSNAAGSDVALSVASMPEGFTGFFKSGSYEVNSRAMQTLSKIAKIIKDYKDYDVLVEGNTDPVPIKRANIRNNWDLSALRASSVVQVLQNDFGVDPSRLTAGGRGEYNPIADNDSELGRQRNRRTEIIITPKLDQFLDLIDKAPDSK